MITAKCATGESLVMSEETTKFLKLAWYTHGSNAVYLLFHLPNKVRFRCVIIFVISRDAFV